MTLVPRVIELLRAQGIDDVLVVGGGTIPAEDIDALKELGVAEVFTPTGGPIGCEHPMGPPFTLCDFIGLDVLYAVCDSLCEEFTRA
jgi:hypothetical protein